MTKCSVLPVAADLPAGSAVREKSRFALYRVSESFPAPRRFAPLAAAFFAAGRLRVAAFATVFPDFADFLGACVFFAAIRSSHADHQVLAFLDPASEIIATLARMM